MSSTPPDSWHRWAERLDVLRVFPRILVMSYYSFFAYAWFYVVDWFMAFDWNQVNDPAVALAVAGFPAAVLGILTGVLRKLTDSYIAVPGYKPGGPE